ncbi:tRNA lysidine(34) synthetase TilS [Winogradskyella sp. PE311]|uniref:tRNA lysidine(34) synthetase TilS n=1 Tax=Winogradskyella sp. PE311 TaxID=3366943 RepID=UPI0039809FAF
MLTAFSLHIKNRLPFLKEKRLLIAVSGGVDSVVLSCLCKKLDFNFALAHCNFNLRAEESNKDENFILKLGDQLGAEVFVQNFDTQGYADVNKLSIQMAARELRYHWFAELADRLHFDYILTAHHADDNLETFLINLTRGTGLNGLTGIPLVNNNVIRPLLNYSRETIIKYALDNNILWREDRSNESRKYLRNKLRHDVVPILKEINPNLLESFQNTIDNLNDTADIVDESLNAVAKRAITKIDDNGITYKISEFKKVNNPKAYLFEMFKAYGFTEWNDVLDLLGAESGKQVLSKTHRLIKHREFLILTEFPDGRHKVIKIKESSVISYFPSGGLHFKNVDHIKDKNDSKIYLDKGKLKYPLELRQWKEGDYFYPLGMKGKKKISKYLKDEKLSLVEKENTWVLTSEGNIIWVIGKRADERYKVTEATSSILKIELK